jgi:hypothetical protein
LRGIAILTLVQPEDIRQALEKTGLPVTADDEALRAEAIRASETAWSIVTHQLSPSIPDLHGMADELDRIAQAGTALIQLIMQGLKLPLPPDVDPRHELARRIAAHHDPLFLNLLSRIAADVGENLAAQALADRIVGVAELIAWCSSTRMAVEAGISRERGSRRDPALRSPARAFGLALIGCYTRLTGRPPARARRPTGPKEGKPIGPLLRFLRHVFDCARKRLRAAPELGALADDKAWSPADETLFEWVERARSAATRT